MMPRFAGLAILASVALPVLAAEPNKLTTKDKLALAERLQSSFVRVEYTLRHDQADTPELDGWQRVCPVCGSFHAVAQGYELLREQRPAELPGYLISDRLVTTSDITVESRFIESVKVRFGKEAVSASPRAWMKTGSTMLLELAEPLTGATPLAFEATAEPGYVLTYDNPGGIWTVNVEPFSAAIILAENGVSFRAAPSGVVVSATGAPVGICLDGELPIDDSWKGSPAARPALSPDQMKKLGVDTSALADKTLLLARLNFRSPKADNRLRRGYEEERAPTEIFAPAVVIDPNRVLVLAELKPDLTARLERITIQLPSGGSQTARFDSSLRHYGAFLAQLATPVSGSAQLAAADITSFRNHLLPTINLRVQGSQRTAHFCQRRFKTFEPGWKGSLRPDAGNSSDTFFFDEAGHLIALPMVMRSRFEQEISRYAERPVPVASSDILAMLADLQANIDPANTPLSEEEENRLAWLGVELQPLDPELARANNVSHLTNEGATGALVSYVYPDSPAAGEGIAPGDILLRIQIPDRPLPIEIQLDRYDFFGANFPWDRLDEIPEQYFDEIPKPWPGADNTLNKTLTEIGFGKKVVLEYVKNGKEISKEITILASPTYYDSAPKFASAPLGLTVRDLTYEVRRYFQRTSDEPGVIVSKVEPGSRASVAGIRPYEIITHVNDKPVMTAKDFENLTSDQKELRLSVKRMLRGRVVKISVDSGAVAEPNADSR